MAEKFKEALHPSPTALAYAQSLLDLANEQNSGEAIGAELDSLREIIRENPTAREVLVNPAIGVEEREQLLERVFRNNVSSLLFNVLGVMNQHGRLGLIGQVADAYDDLLEQQLGKVEVDVIVAQKLDSDQLEQARQKIKAALGRDPVIHQYMDENIIGGVVIRVGDRLIDASVKSQLESLKQQMLAAAPK